MKYYVSMAHGGTYGLGRAYKIYKIKNSGEIIESVAGVYFSLKKGHMIDIEDTRLKKLIYNSYNEAKKYVMRDSIKGSLKGDKIYKYKELAKSLIKGNKI